MNISVSLVLTAIATLATIIGVAFAILSIATYWQANKKVDDRFDQKYEEHRKKLDDQSAQWASGIRLWTRAQMTPDVVEAALTMEKALQAWPSAPGARIEMLERLCDDTESAYILDLIPTQRWAKTTMRVMSQQSCSEYVPDQHRSECIVWLTQCDQFERHIDPVRIDWMGAKIYAMIQDPHTMFRRLGALPDGIGEPDDRSRLILLSGVHDIGTLDRLNSWWARRFAHPIVTDYPTTLQASRKTLNGRLQPWLVVPKTPMSKTTTVGIAPHGESGWSVQSEEKQDPDIADTLEDLVAFVHERWIPLAPIPFS